MDKRQQGSKRKFKPAGKHSKSLKKIVKLIESIGFEFVGQSNKVHFKHPKRKCSIFFAGTPSDQNAVRNIVRRLKKDLLNCQPPFDVNSLPGNVNLNQLRFLKNYLQHKHPVHHPLLVHFPFHQYPSSISTDSNSHSQAMNSHQKEVGNSANPFSIYEQYF